MTSSRKLPLSFDPEPLKADLENIPAGEWMPHFNQSYFEGEWSGVALRAVEGALVPLLPDPTGQGRYADTELLGRCTHLRAAVAAFRCPLRAVRLLRLTAGSRIREHRDYDLAVEDGEIRIHVPILTNSGVRFYLAGEPLALGEGESWYINFNLPHRVENLGDTDRVHLVLDCGVNDWMREMLAACRDASSPPGIIRREGND